ncbi:MAG: DUF5715 family protein [Leptospiraceae bacterium]|nr:DUF5715 family protein [Leptospiraceae bacterium]MDW7975339.1 DUF5715 family protein [Leptospiraceae bacterium]
MKNLKNFFLLIVITILTIVIAYLLYSKLKLQRELRSYTKTKNLAIKEFYQFIYQNFPIFEDWLDEEKKKSLRTYLYPYHIELANHYQLTSIRSSKELNQNNFKSLENPDIRTYYFFYNVPNEFRYFHRKFYPVLILIGEEFQKTLNFQSYPIKVKLAISSALRPADYQKLLKLKNPNAIENSTHAYGISIDIFYDEFYVDFSFLCENYSRFIQELCKKDIVELGYLMGGNLRRQFTAILAETLLRMQKENVLYVIWEKNQRVFHITPIPKE